jgi:ABC-type multidrug transport system ATPase subunit
MVISLENVRKRFGKVSALSDVAIKNLTSGECLCVVGRNGAGKTTLFNILTDLVKADSLDLSLNGQPIAPSQTEWKQMLGIASDEVPPIHDFTAADFLKFTGLLYGLTAQTIQQRSSSLLKFFFDSEPIDRKRIGDYSVGMKKKVSLCAAVIHKPPVLILDEPLSGLDIVSIDRVISFLHQYRNRDSIVIISSHNISHIRDLVTRVVVLDLGVKQFDGTVADFTHDGKYKLDHALFNFISQSPKDMSDLDWINGAA